MISFHTINTRFFIFLTWAIFTISPLAIAHDSGAEIERKIISDEALTQIPGHSFTSVIVNLKPGASAPAHQHQAFVFAYVISGTVTSQLNQESTQTYSVGDSWIEQPGDQHSLTKNMSSTKSAQLLAVFVAKTGAELTSSTVRLK